MANKTICALTYGDTHVFTLPYGTCSTAAATAAKTVAVQDGKFSLETGARVCIKFTVTNTASNPTLNVSGTGAKAIMYRGSAISAGYLAANRIYEFIYDGTDWELIGDVNTNTTNTTGTTNKTGTKLYLAGATSQATGPTTYSNSGVYIGTDNCLYSNGSKVATENSSILMEDLANLYIWEKLSHSPNYTLSTATASPVMAGSTSSTSGRSVTVSRKFFPSYQVNNNGTFKLTGTPIVISGSYSVIPSSIASVIGYYTSQTSFQDDYTEVDNLSKIYQVTANTTISNGQTSHLETAYYGWRLVSTTQITLSNFTLNTTSHGFVCDKNSDSYPKNDGYDYIFCGEMGKKVQIATGTYVGTGLCGANYPNHLQFNFTPKFVWLQGNSQNVGGLGLLTNTYTVRSVAEYNGGWSAYGRLMARFEFNGCSWYVSDGTTPEKTWYPRHQYNAEGVTYYYFAIG